MKINIKAFKNQQKSTRYFNSFLLRFSITAVLIVLANISNLPIMYALLGLSSWLFITAVWHLHLSMKFARIADKEAKA